MSPAISSLRNGDDHLLVYRVLYIACRRELVDGRKAGAAIQYRGGGKVGALFCYRGHIIGVAVRLRIKMLAATDRLGGTVFIFLRGRSISRFISFNKPEIIRC